MSETTIQETETLLCEPGKPERILPGETAEACDVARERCSDAAEAVERAYAASAAFIASGEAIAPDALYVAIEDLLEVVASSPLVAWPQVTWRFLAAVSGMAEIIASSGDGWFVRQAYPRELTSEIIEAVSFADTLRDPRMPAPKVVELEDIKELIEQRLSDRQIAVLYEWTLPNGEPDARKARECRRGNQNAPKTKTHPLRLAGPRRQPQLGGVDQLAAEFAAAREGAASSAL